MSNEFEAICRRVQAAPPSRLRNDALDLIGAQRAQAMLTVEMAATAQAAQNECAALRRDLDTMRQRAEAAEAALTAVPVEALRQLRTHLSDDGDYSITRTDGERMWIGDSLVLGSLFEKIDAWLAWQSEVQP